MSIENEQARLHVYVSGRVQGVGFRYFVLDHAQRLNLTGWVRNLWNGGVELIAEGEQAQLEQLLAVIKRGPAGARVNKIEPRWSAFAGEFGGFHIRQTN
jgi:acylphosphatase